MTATKPLIITEIIVDMIMKIVIIIIMMMIILIIIISMSIKYISKILQCQ
jgi:hypothetical protein